MIQYHYYKRKFWILINPEKLVLSSRSCKAAQLPQRGIVLLFTKTNITWILTIMRPTLWINVELATIIYCNILSYTSGRFPIGVGSAKCAGNRIGDRRRPTSIRATRASWFSRYPNAVPPAFCAFKLTQRNTLRNRTGVGVWQL